MSHTPTKFLRAASPLLIAMLLSLGLSGCNTLSRLAEIGSEPEMSPIVNPTHRPNYRPVTLPMPQTEALENNPNSLWRSGARAFFKDNRANEIGDILTISITLDDQASLENSTERSRSGKENTGLPNLFGLQNKIVDNLPEGADANNLIGYASNHATGGDGKIDRKEKIALTVAAVITQVLPNGNMVVTGRQEIRVNSELRELMVTGVIRREDIDPSNTIDHTKIAEMRMAYGGRGTLSELQKPRWGVELWDTISPF